VGGSQTVRSKERVRIYDYGRIHFRHSKEVECNGNRLYSLHLPYSVGPNKTSGIIGVRFARNCHPDDLWTTYFTSSKYVKKFREEYGEPDVIEVRQTFNDSLQAREWEEKVIDRMGAVIDEKWLNKHNRGKFYLKYHSKETKEKTKAALMGHLVSEETRTKISVALKGRIGSRQGSKCSEETKEKLRHYNLGKTLSEETKKKMAESKKGKTHSKKRIRGKTLSEEHRKKISEAKKNISKETRCKLSEANKGKTHSTDTKQKISKSNKGFVTALNIKTNETSRIPIELFHSNKDIYFCNTSKIFKELQQKRNN